ncbi:kinase-like domain, phloem protein 2-like protein [Tanacetum coccineum]
MDYYPFRSFSLYYNGDAALYIEGIEFRAIDKAKHEEIVKLKEVKQVLKSDFIDGKKLLVLSAKAALYKFTNVKTFTSKPPAQSRFQKVIELLPQQVFHIKCTINSQLLSSDTEYVCYLLFKLSKNCQGMHCPVKVRDIPHQENKEAEFLYFITLEPSNIHDITRVPKQREDGWMEIQLWKFKSAHEFKDVSPSINMRFTSLEGTMSGLIVCGLEFRPVLEVKIDGLALLLDSLWTESDKKKSGGLQKENVVGEGAFGKRYKGQLLWFGELIDITLRLTNKEWYDEIEQQFWTEISMLSSLMYSNLASIVGFCNEVGAETIIYKHGSTWRLEKYLSDATLLTWVRRLEISVSVAHAISYIHYDETRDFSVIHQNNSYTVRLNNDWEPTLSGFEHSMKIKACERHNSFHIDSVLSRKGYTDPTCFETNIGGHKSDIYSFGIILFELLCGRKSVSDDQDNKYLAPEHSSVVDEVEGTSSGHEERSGSESQVSKKTKSFLKDVSHLKLSVEDISSATNNFDDENVLNEYGSIYKGRLLRSEQFIDIVGKGYQSDSEKDDSKMFRVELSMLSSLKHKNLVSLIGFIDEAGVGPKVIIYKREANGSLDKYLSDQTLTWMQRLKICVGVAKALSYIHYDVGRDFSVIHVVAKLDRHTSCKVIRISMYIVLLL